MLEKMDEIAATICKDTGKPQVEVITLEIISACDALTYCTKNAARLLKDEKRSLHLLKTKKVVTSYRPMGVIGIISAWSSPLLVSLNPAVRALIAGNTVVVKPSEVTPFVGIMLGKLFEAAGFPEGVFQIVIGDDATSTALIEAGCDKISFTGSVSLGRRVAEACGARLIPFSLGLGGKDPMIVCDDAHLERAAQGAVWGAFCSSGQRYSSTERVYVTKKLAERFISLVVDLTKELRQGPEEEGEVDVGAITFPPWIETIERQVSDALAKGAKVRTGGQRNPLYQGFFYEPTVLTHVNHEMAVMREETFGPVLPIQIVADEDEALRLANDIGSGLSANVWTRSRQKGKEIASRLNSCAVVIDDCSVSYGITETPPTGVNGSGVGPVNGESGLKSYCHSSSLIIGRLGAKRELFRYPYSARKLRRVRKFVDLLYRSRFGKLFRN
jgi:acyl-CoA reductase-like NAD-dependent aldehyde dehydrogenase